MEYTVKQNEDPQSKLEFCVYGDDEIIGCFASEVEAKKYANYLEHMQESEEFNEKLENQQTGHKPRF